MKPPGPALFPLAAEVRRRLAELAPGCPFPSPLAGEGPVAASEAPGVGAVATPHPCPPPQGGRGKEVRLVVAVSGGADSVALLRALAEVSAPGRLTVAHLNHRLRAEAGADAAFVAALAAFVGAAFVGAERDVATESAAAGDN